MINYSKGVNLASDIISDTVRVSTATFPRDAYYGGGKDALIETWIFNNNPLLSKQYIHKHGRERAIRFHNYLVKRLRRCQRGLNQQKGNKMEKYNQYKTLTDKLKESKNWINNKNKTDSQSHTPYSLHNISFSADYCGQAYAGANNYHSSPKEFNAYMSKAIKKNFSQLTEEAILLMEEDVKKALIACEVEINEIQKNIELSKLDVVAESE